MPWKFHAMPCPVIPDESEEALSCHMVCLAASLKVLHEFAREAILKRQVRNMREYNKRKAVVQHEHGETFFEGDMVWVLNPNLRRNKLHCRYDGPYFITKFLGEQKLTVELSMDGVKHIVRSVDHICQYHRTRRFASSGHQTENEPNHQQLLRYAWEMTADSTLKLHLYGVKSSLHQHGHNSNVACKRN